MNVEGQVGTQHFATSHSQLHNQWGLKHSVKPPTKLSNYKEVQRWPKSNFVNVIRNPFQEYTLQLVRIYCQEN